MYPLLSLGTVAVSSYQVCLAVAFIAGAGLLLYANGNAPKPLRMGPFMIVPFYLASLAGAKSMFLVVPENAAPSARVFSLWKGGYWYHGGLAGGIAGYVLYHAAKRNNIADALDRAAPFLALGEAITRIGCFLNGCCWGVPAAGFPGMVFPPDSHVWQQQFRDGLIAADAGVSLPAHPVQLYMALSMLFMYVALRLVAHRQAVQGEIALLFFVAHGFVRFWLEFLRGDTLTAFHGLSLTQWIAIAMAIPALAGLFVLYGRARAANAAGEALACR